jgi:hypothetical protein
MVNRYATLLLGSYRTGDANDPEVYVAAITAVMSDYPEDVLRSITDPRTGIPSRLEWLPKPAEVKAACEEIEGPRRRIREWNKRAEQQLAERAELEGAPRKVPQHIMDELAAHGLTKQARLRDMETPGKVMAKYGLTQEQWDALPPAKIGQKA